MTDWPQEDPELMNEYEYARAMKRRTHWIHNFIHDQFAMQVLNWGEIDDGKDPGPQTPR